MITLHPHPENVELCRLKDGKKSIPVFWHPVRNKDLRLAVTDLGSFATEEMRDKFRLSSNQMDMVLDHMKNGTEIEGGLQHKFFKVKRAIEDSLYSEMNLSDSSQELVLDYPKGNDTWGELCLTCGASSSGKTYSAVSKALRCLDGPEKHRRRFVVISNEWEKDKTLAKLKKEKYRKWVTGVDVSDCSLDNSEHGGPQSFYDKEVKPHIEFATEGTVILFDDPMDSCCAPQLRKSINKLLRTARHDAVGINFILHSIRSGVWSSTASSNCKYFVLFPRSQRGKCRDFLNKEIGCTLPEARDHVHDFGQVARAMHVRLFSPQCLISDKLIRLL